MSWLSTYKRQARVDGVGGLGLLGCHLCAFRGLLLGPGGISECAPVRRFPLADGEGPVVAGSSSNFSSGGESEVSGGGGASDGCSRSRDTEARHVSDPNGAGLVQAWRRGSIRVLVDHLRSEDESLERCTRIRTV